MYIYDLPDWPKFHWDEPLLASRLNDFKVKQARLLGRMEGLGPNFQAESHLRYLASEIMRSCEIEGHVLDQEAVYKTLGDKLGLREVKPLEQKVTLKTLDIGTVAKPTARADDNVDGLVRVILDATSHFEDPLSQIRMFGWYANLDPARKGQDGSALGRYRSNPREEPLRVVSGLPGKETVHFVAPDSGRIQAEMDTFLEWFNAEQVIDPILKAGIAHIWFLNIYPFAAGNGIMARLATQMLLCRSDLSAQCYFSLSAQMRRERNQYFAVLERAGRDSLDITHWLAWFIDCLHRAMHQADDLVAEHLAGLKIRDRINGLNLNERQRAMLNRMSQETDKPISSSVWASHTNCSQDSAGRDIHDLLERNILLREPGGGRSTSYSLNLQGLVQ